MATNPIKVTRKDGRWVARFRWSHETKEVVRQAGWQFSPREKIWYTTDAAVAVRLDPDARTAAREEVITRQQAIADSRATDDDIQVPAPVNLDYRPFQRAGIAYLLSHPDVLLADEMGLGKTIEVAGLINADPTLKRILIVSPASLRVNWARELSKWLVRPVTLGFVEGQNLPDTEIVIVQYNILHRHRQAIDRIRWDLLVADECHLAVNTAARRTRALYGRTSRKPEERQPPIRARRRVYISGSPIVNRPKELWTVVHQVDPHGLGRSYFKFHMRYCNGHHNGWGWDFSGANHLDELQTRLRSSCMLRRLKADVLSELPPKQRQIIVIPRGDADGVVQREWGAFQRHKQQIDRAEAAAERAREGGNQEEYDAAMRELNGSLSVGFEDISRLRHDTAVAKIPHVVDHVRECLEITEKLVIFIHHNDVAQALREAFPLFAFVTGRVRSQDRQAEIDRFQTDPNCRGFIGSISAAGVGLTLTAAQLAIFAELDWVPGNITQAEDRLHRIGQVGSVLIQHLVFVDSVDSYMANVIIDKQKVIIKGLDTRIPACAAL